jgi:hypothetical protein
MLHVSTIRFSRSVLLLLCLIGVIGCERNARGLSVDKAGARQACTTFLTAWKDGKKATDLKPKITGKDSDWEAGKTLESFEILPEERTDGANLFLTVRRTIKAPEGASQQQEVGYVVGTSPIVTVFRTDE